MKLPKGIVRAAKVVFRPDTPNLPVSRTATTPRVPQATAPVTASLGKNALGDQFTQRWLLMDRFSAANDNAEHLYEYAMEHCPDLDLWFVLERDSADWDRLSAKGFKLVAPNSHEHNLLLAETDAVVSSHADHPVITQCGSKHYGERRWRYVFLQHGITKDDLSRWLNGKRIDLMITSSVLEHGSIVADGTNYDLTDREVALTGFPRHDRLISLGKAQQSRRVLLIAPTWRREVILPLREGNGALHESSYWQQWDALLRSESIARFVESGDHEVVLLPHPDIVPFLDAGAYESLGIRVASYREDIQQLLAETFLGMTDYSSLVFDLAVLETPTIYFQFDQDQFFNGQHVYDKGYFDYETDGFGPVITDLHSLETVLSDIKQGNSTRLSAGRQRAAQITPWHDGKNCERTVQAIRERLEVVPVKTLAS